ncbi:MAG TPA: DsrE family protein [Candidatus Binatia bacterium]|nr:DsrE family protein [Candidatus Binatia bacterium]
MKMLITINDAPYGSERAYNALRLAGSLAKQEGIELKVFLVGDGAACAKSGQKVLQGYYNVQTMLSAVVRRGAQVGVCGSCMEARGIAEAELVEGTHKSSLDEWTRWTTEADKALVF